MNRFKIKTKRRTRRRLSARKKLIGTKEVPRLAVFRSARHIYAQLIDDSAGATLISVSTQTKGLKESLKKTGNRQAAEVVGKEVAKKALEAGFSRIAFDRGGFKYHGRVKALADGARAGGLKF